MPQSPWCLLRYYEYMSNLLSGKNSQAEVTCFSFSWPLNMQPVLINHSGSLTYLRNTSAAVTILARAHLGPPYPCIITRRIAAARLATYHSTVAAVVKCCFQALHVLELGTDRISCISTTRLGLNRGCSGQVVQGHSTFAHPCSMP